MGKKGIPGSNQAQETCSVVSQGEAVEVVKGSDLTQEGLHIPFDSGYN